MTKDEGTYVLYSLKYASFQRFVSVKGTGCRREASSYYYVEACDGKSVRSQARQLFLLENAESL